VDNRAFTSPMPGRQTVLLRWTTYQMTKAKETDHSETVNILRTAAPMRSWRVAFPGTFYVFKTASTSAGLSRATLFGTQNAAGVIPRKGCMTGGHSCGRLPATRCWSWCALHCRRLDGEQAEFVLGKLIRTPPRLHRAAVQQWR
jgi:hypothetical protein